MPLAEVPTDDDYLFTFRSNGGSERGGRPVKLPFAQPTGTKLDATLGGPAHVLGDLRLLCDRELSRKDHRLYCSARGGRHESEARVRVDGRDQRRHAAASRPSGANRLAPWPSMGLLKAPPRFSAGERAAHRRAAPADAGSVRIRHPASGHGGGRAAAGQGAAGPAPGTGRRTVAGQVRGGSTRSRRLPDQQPRTGPECPIT